MMHLVTCHWISLEMHLLAVIEHGLRLIWPPTLSKIGDAVEEDGSK